MQTPQHCHVAHRSFFFIYLARSEILAYHKDESNDLPISEHAE
jgi:hypothetical protein